MHGTGANVQDAEAKETKDIYGPILPKNVKDAEELNVPTKLMNRYLSVFVHFAVVRN